MDVTIRNPTEGYVPVPARRELPPLCRVCGKELTSEEHINREIRFDKSKLEQIATILSAKGHNNVALIGKAGTGKTALVSALSAEVAAGRYKTLAGRRIVEIDVDKLLNNVYTPAERGTRMANLLIEAERERIILFIDEGHRLYGNGESNNLANIMKPFLTRDRLQVIIATTIDEYNLFIAQDPAFRRRFEPVVHKEPNAEETLEILRHVIQKRHPDVTADDEALKEIVNLGRRYVLDRNNPDKSLALLDTVVAWEANRCGRKKITQDVIREVLSARIGVPKASLCADMKSGLDGMETYLNEKFPGWEEVCRKLTKSLEKSLTRGLRQHGPLSATVLCGPDTRLMLDLAKTAVRKLGCVGEGAVYVIDVNRADPSDPFTSYVRRNPNAAIIFTGISIATPPQVLGRLREVLASGVLKSESGLTASYRHSNVFVLCEGEAKKTNAVGFVRDDSVSYTVDGDTAFVLEAIGVDRNGVITVGAPDAGKTSGIYERVFLPLLTRSASKCGYNIKVVLAETAREEILTRLRSVTAWSAMYDAIEEIVLTVMAHRPDENVEQIVIGWGDRRFRTEEKRPPQPDVGTRE